MAGSRIDQAGSESIRENVIQTRLVVTDAWVYLVCSSTLRFDNELGIRQEWTSH
jgi:hypothetical protein